ncbi:MAG TPA: RND transporter, partial [Cupriavidus sp.]|nr:RND transporter [Cupriavidus sp.]
PLLHEEKIPVMNFGDIGLNVSYLIDFWGKLKRADEAALASAQASHAALDQARVGVVAETVRAYVQGCTATHELHVAAHQLDLQERGVKLAQKLVDAGRGQPTDLLRAEAQADTLRSALPKYRAEQEGAAYRLAVMLGKPPTALDVSSVACEHVPALKQALPVGDGMALLKRRPDVRQAERELASATAKIGVATADLFPQIRIGASAGFTGILDHLGQAPTAHWGWGPAISWTIPTSGTRARIHNMEYGAEGALAHFDGVVLKALRETQTALSAYTHELDRNASLRSARDKANEAARQNRLLWQAGRSPYLQSLDADRTLANTDAALAASDAQVAMDQINLFLALGGGWQNAPAIASHPVGKEPGQATEHTEEH